jgi:tRNA(adenine34) deaminase
MIESNVTQLRRKLSPAESDSLALLKVRGYSLEPESDLFELDEDEEYMYEALVSAQLAAAAGEVPIGAIVIDERGMIIGHGYNQVEGLYCQAEHAEVQAIRQASQHKKNWRLTGCTLYVTLEPCVMCMALASLSRIDRVVYGADSPLFGYRLDKEGSLTLYLKHIKGITSGVLADESAKLLRKFFSEKRMRDNEQQ